VPESTEAVEIKSVEPERKKKRESEPKGAPVFEDSDNDFLKEHKITVDNGGYAGSRLQIVRTFATSGFSSTVLKATETFTSPTPIQAVCWPILNAGSDIIGVAETGSGKTLTFGLPSVTNIIKKKSFYDSKRVPGLCIVAPTRELAQQTHDLLKIVADNTGLKIICLYGGLSKDPQKRQLKEGVHIVVGCPGRIVDLVNDGALDLSQVTHMVLDEADRMLDMGFEADIRKILGFVNPKRQVAMFSATWPLQIRALASEFLRDAIRITIGSKDLHANVKITQIVEVIEPEKRDYRLLELIKLYQKSPTTKILIFALYKNETVRLEQFLKGKRIPVTAIHGNLNQSGRNAALEAFKIGNPSIMIATDVASRGLHIPQVEFVINYSFPLTIEDYVHRIGRTGRAGCTGTSHTFFQQYADKARSGELIGVLRKAGAVIPTALLDCGTFIVKKEPKLGKIDMNAKSQSVALDNSDSDSDL
jgi:ATP-dependent RNA helicase DBP3